MGPKTHRLLKRVGLRLRIASLGSRFHLFFLVLSGVYLVLLVLSRLFVLLPGSYFTLTAPSGVLPLASVAALALLLAAIFTHRAGAGECARLVDARMKTKDVFLTVTRLEGALGEFKPLVLRDAETRAGDIQSRLVGIVPFAWRAKGRDTALAAGVLLAAVLLLPQWDLLGREAAREAARERTRRLEESRKAVTERAAILRKSDVESRLSKPVELAVNDLKQTFGKMKRTDAAGNLKQLGVDQKNLGELWRKISEQKLRNSLGGDPMGQSFGTRDLQKQAEWKKQAEQGDFSGLRKEITELETLARKLERLGRSSEGEAVRREMKQRLQALSDFMEKGLNSRPCSNALAQALDHLGAGGLAGLSKEALEALKESLDLSELELSKLAQSMGDLKDLEEALKALQLAKRLNDLDALDGSDCEGCGGIGDYAELYRRMMAARAGAGPRPGMGGKGTGEGGKAPEKSDAETDYVGEQSRSAMTAGKILLQWKTRGIAEAGQAKIDYERRLEDVRKGVSEAILREQVPPGYHDAIRNYFDSLEENGGKPESP